MKQYTVAIVTDPAVNGDFSRHYEILDMISGSSLVENPQAPEMKLTVTSDNEDSAVDKVIVIAHENNVMVERHWIVDVVDYR